MTPPLPLAFRDAADLDIQALQAVQRMIHAAFGNTDPALYFLVPMARYAKVLVAWSDTEPVCAIEGLRNWHDPTQMQCTSICVAPAHQDRGILTATLTHLLATLPAEGVTRVGAHIPVNHPAMWRVFVEKAGFQPNRRIDACFGPGDDRLYLERPSPLTPDLESKTRRRYLTHLDRLAAGARGMAIATSPRPT